MMPLRQLMMEGMQVCKFSPHTQSTYIRHVSRFARYLGNPPDQLGSAEIRCFQTNPWLRRNRHSRPWPLPPQTPAASS
jgi:hypothetical protein